MNKETASSRLDLAGRDNTGHANLANKNLSSKTSHVLAHLVMGDSITPLEALQLYGSLRLSAIIFRLKARGYDIGTDLVQVGSSRVARYSIKDVEKARTVYFAQKGLQYKTK